MSLLCITILLGLLAGASAKLQQQSLLVYPRRTDIVVNQHTTLTLGCRGSEILTWTFPGARERQIDNSSHIISKINRKDRDYKFESILVVENVTHADVGFYHCHGQIVDFDTGLRSNRIYVYVYGDVLLIMTTQEKELTRWSGIFPCIPTSPDITIELTCGSYFRMLVTPRNYTTHVKYEDGWVRFHTYVGFTLRNIYSLKYWDCTCRLTRDLTVSSIHFNPVDGFAELYRYSLSIAQSPDSVNVGDNVSVQCVYISTALKPYYTLEFHWQKCDQNSINERSTVHQQIIILKPVAHAVVTTLTIQNISTADEGCYQCCAYNTIDKIEHYNKKDIFVNDADARRGAPRIYDPDQQEIQFMSGDNVTLRCEGSRPITWRGPGQKYHSDEIEHLLDKQDGRYKSILHLVRLRYKDIGFYYCHENGFVPTHPFKSDKLYIFVKDGIHLSAKANNYDKFFQPYANVTVPCLPTSRNVSVSLSMSGYNIWRGKRVEITNPAIYEFDPRTGFTVQMPDFRYVDAECTFTTQTMRTTRRFPYYRDDYIYHLMKILEPTITGSHEDSVSVGETLKLSCAVLVRPNIHGAALLWTLPNDSTDAQITYDYLSIPSGYLIITKLILYDANKINEGRYNCSFMHNIATATKYISVFVTFILKQPAPEILGYDYAYVDQPFVLQCTVNVDHNIDFQIGWITSNVTEVEEMTNKTEYIQGIRHLRGNSILEIPKVTHRNAGSYTCYVDFLKDNVKYVTQYVKVKRGKPARLEMNNNKPEIITVYFGDPVTLSCSAVGDPKPTITWKKDSAALQVIDGHINFSSGKSYLSIYAVGVKDAGIYACAIHNLYGTDFRDVSLYVMTASYEDIMLKTFINVFMLLIVIVGLLIFRVTYTIKEYKQRLFDIYNIHLISRDQQRTILPFDLRWEIPKHNIELGHNLGSGCFGLVVKATVSNVFEGEPLKTVAVKMLHQHSSFGDLNSLLHELGILSQIENHINIVTLLGACMDNVMERKLLVVIEYCKNGNLQNYLVKNRYNFINLKNSDTDLICFPPHYNFYEDAGPSSAVAETAALQGFNTLDLLFWSLQVAQGMDFLASNKICHGDLAARNILLAENNIVKISDFGLSRNLDSNGFYKEKSQGPLPIKWMALESIRDKTFSSQSDVWSFGVMLWELFSLGQVPYPSMPMDLEFYRNLDVGYRLGRPDYSTKEIYQMMLECWHAQPVRRPTFPCLVLTLTDFLTQNLRMDYTSDSLQYEKNWKISSTEQVTDLSAEESVRILLENPKNNTISTECVVTEEQIPEENA